MKMMRNAVSIFLTFVIAVGMIITPISAATPPAWSDSYTAQGDVEAYKDGDGRDFRTWLQYDPRWSSLPLGTGTGTKTVGEEGCTVTAITKLMIEAGLATPTELNPGILVSYLNENGGFVTSGSLIGSLYWAKVSDFATAVLGKTFTLVDSYFQSGTLSSTDQTYKDKIIGWLNEGYHLVLNVGASSGTHWIAVDEYATLDPNNTANEIYIMDSWNTDSAKRCNISLSDYLSSVYGTTKFYRIAAYKTDLSDADNSNSSYYNTDYYRKYSRYDSRWATTELDRPTTIEGEYVGEWGQALLSLTKTLIASGAVAAATTPNDVLATLKEKELIGAADGIIDWTNLENYAGDVIIDAASTSTSAADTYATIRDGILNGKHYIIQFNKSGSVEHAWSAIDEARTLAGGDTVYLLASGKELQKNAGYYTYSDVKSSLGSVKNLYYFTASTSPRYVQFNYAINSGLVPTGTGKVSLAATGAGESGTISASYIIGDETIEVRSGGYVPEGTAVTVTTTAPTGFSGYALSTTSGSVSGSGNSFTVIAGSETTTVTATATAASYTVISNDTTDTCGFSYTNRPTSATYNSTVKFTVTPVNDTYTVTVTAKDAEDNELAVTKSGDDYTFTQPASDVTVTVSAETKRYTVYLNEADIKDASNPAAWYVYTWTDVDYAPEWKAGTLTAEGYYEFKDVQSKVNFVRADAKKTDFLDLNDTDKWNSKWGQSNDQQAVSDYTETKNLFTLTEWNNNGNGQKLQGTWSEMSGPNTVYLYPKALDVRAEYVVNGTGGKSIYDAYPKYPTDYYAKIADQYYAYTRNAGSTNYTWIKGTVDSNGVLKFEGVKELVTFYRIDPDTKPDTSTAAKKNIDSDTVWGYTDEQAVNTAAADMYVLNRYYYASESNYSTMKEKMLLHTDQYADVADTAQYCKDNQIESKYAYKYYTQKDSRWNTINLGTSTTDTNLVGDYYLAQELTKLLHQADIHTNWDVTDVAVNAFNSYGNHAFPTTKGTLDSSLGLTVEVNTKYYYNSDGVTPAYMNSTYACMIYDYLLAGKHVLLRAGKDEGEWYVVDAEKTLFETTSYSTGAGAVGPKIYILRSTNNIGDNVGGMISSRYDEMVVERFCNFIVFSGGTTPGLTRDFDYRRWSIYDGRWADLKMTTSTTQTMKTRGALVVAAAKMMIQAGIYDTSRTPLDLYNYIITHNKFTEDGALKWADVDSYSGGFYQFASSADDGEAYVFLKFKESITIDGREVTGYPRRLGSSAYKVNDEYLYILEAIKQGYHMMLEVSNGTTENSQMWLTIDEKLSLEKGDIYVMDATRFPGKNAELTLREAGYTYLFRVVGYEGATTPVPEDQTIGTETEDGKDVVIMSPSLRPVTTDPSYLGRTVVTDDEDNNSFEYAYIYGPDAQVRVTVTGVVKGNTYQLSLASNLSDAMSFDPEKATIVRTTADKAGLLEQVIELSDFALDTTAGGNTGGTHTIYLAVRNIATKSFGESSTDYENVSSNILTTSMTYTAHELVTGFNDTADKTLYIYKTASENDLINAVSGYLTHDAGTLEQSKDYDKPLDRSYTITDSKGNEIGLSDLSAAPGEYTVTLTRVASAVGTQTIATDSTPVKTVLIDPARSSYKIRVVTPASYIYRYLDRNGNETVYTEYLDDTLTADEIKGYAGNSDTPGMPQYKVVDSDTGLSNKLISNAPKQVAAGFNKNLRWKADTDKIVLNNRDYAVTLNAEEEEATYTVTFQYGDGKADVVKTGTYNTLITLGGDELPTVDGSGNKFAYWTDATGRVASVYPGFNMMIAEDATFTAYYGNAPSGDTDGDGVWQSYTDGVKLSYKIEGNNRKATRTVYTDFSLRFIDGDRRIQKLLGDANADDLGYVVSYGLVVTYDMNEANAAVLTDNDTAEFLKSSAQIVANAGRTNVARTKDTSKFRFLNFNFSSASLITNRNRADVGVPWDYDTYAGKNVIGYSYVIYCDKSGSQQIAISDGMGSTVTWPASTV